VTYAADDARYQSMIYRRCGRSGLKLPAISLGLWHNFGHDRPLTTQQEICRRAFDRGVTHFDLANNYGPPYQTQFRTRPDPVPPHRLRTALVRSGSARSAAAAPVSRTGSEAVRRMARRPRRCSRSR